MTNANVITQIIYMSYYIIFQKESKFILTFSL